MKQMSKLLSMTISNRRELKMNLSRATTIGLSVALLCTPVLTRQAYAEGAFTFTIPIVNAQFPPTGCSLSTPSGVTLNGQYRFVVHRTKNPDGTYSFKFQSNATGTATDTDGNQYVFNYINHEQDISPSPEDLPPVFVTTTDRFALISKGSAANVKVEFQVVFFVDAQGNVQFISGVFKGDPSCDPI